MGDIVVLPTKVSLMLELIVQRGRKMGMGSRSRSRSRTAWWWSRGNPRKFQLSWSITIIGMASFAMPTAMPRGCSTLPLRRQGHHPHCPLNDRQSGRSCPRTPRPSWPLWNHPRSPAFTTSQLRMGDIVVLPTKVSLMLELIVQRGRKIGMG